MRSWRRAVKRVERVVRLALIACFERLFAVKQRSISFEASPRILVVRIDQRVGNMVMLTPLLSSLKQRFPQARIDVLGHPKTEALMQSHPCIDAFLPFQRRHVFASGGPVARVWFLRRQRYDLAIDAGNPTDPSTSQAVLVRLSGARHTVGFDHPGFGKLFSAPVPIPDEAVQKHEIDLRLLLLNGLPGNERTRTPSLGPLDDRAVSARIRQFYEESLRQKPFVVINIGARLTEKQLGPTGYAAIAALVHHKGWQAVLTYGPLEESLARSTHELAPLVIVAPQTSLMELAFLFARAQAVVSCDTGPMHVAVALGTPTCGLFVSTEPHRYGYSDAPHTCIDTRAQTQAQWLSRVASWLAEQERKAADGLIRSVHHSRV